MNPEQEAQKERERAEALAEQTRRRQDAEYFYERIPDHVWDHVRQPMRDWQKKWENVA